MKWLKKTIPFIIVNIIVIALFFIITSNEWLPEGEEFPFALKIVFLLFFVNLLFAPLLMSWADRDTSKIDINVESKEVSSSKRLLRYAAAGLAFISFLTTEEGLKTFVFSETEEWKAYILSFSVQTALLVFSFLFPNFNILISKLKEHHKFPELFKRFLMYVLVLLFAGSLTVSSTFSFVFIANNTYKSMWSKNSNITIEEFLKEETYRLRAVNDEVGEQLRGKISGNVNSLKTTIQNQENAVVKKNRTAIKDMLSQNPITKYNKPAVIFYTDIEYNNDYSNSRYPTELTSVYNTFNSYQTQYDTYYTKYGSEYGDYDNLKNDTDGKQENIDESVLQGKIQSLNSTKTAIENIMTEIDILETRHYKGSLSSYKNRAIGAFRDLKDGFDDIKNIYEQLVPLYQAITTSSSASTSTPTVVKDILTFVYTDEYNDTKIKSIQRALSNQQGILLGADKIDDMKLQELAELREDFNNFVRYVDLKKQISGFVDGDSNPDNGDLSISYYVISEGETDPPTGENVLPEAEWNTARKKDFATFVSCLKLLPDLTQYQNDEEDTSAASSVVSSSAASPASSSAVSSSVASSSTSSSPEANSILSTYDPDEVLEKAYTMNRDLLEKISEFEKAFNYFKYDFKLMAVLSLFMALFMDITSFLIGWFMFASGYFDVEKKKKESDDAAEEPKAASTPEQVK